MSNPVVLTPSAANKIRAAVTAISMPSRPFGVLGSSARATGGARMPLDMSLVNVDNSGQTETHASLRIGGLYVTSGTRVVAVDATRNSALATAMAAHSETFDLGALPSGGVLAACLYVAAVVGSTGEVSTGINILPKWGVVTGASMAAAIQAVPSIGGDDSTAGSVRGILAMVPVGAVSVYPGDPPLAQLYRGAVAMPALVAVSVLSGFQYDATAHQLQIKTRNAMVAPIGDETAWTLANADAQAEVYP